MWHRSLSVCDNIAAPVEWATKIVKNALVDVIFAIFLVRVFVEIVIVAAAVTPASRRTGTTLV
jgi:hypothetical protein